MILRAGGIISELPCVYMRRNFDTNTVCYGDVTLLGRWSRTTYQVCQLIIVKQNVGLISFLQAISWDANFVSNNKKI